MFSLGVNPPAAAICGRGRGSPAFGHSLATVCHDGRRPSVTPGTGALTMKTAISIPDDVFDAADEMAKRLGMSRSQLYSTAVRRYLDAHRNCGVTAQLDQIYEYQDSSLDLRVAEAQTASLDDEDW